MLRLDPIRDREEYGALVELLEAGTSTEGDGAEGVMGRLLASPDPRHQALGARMRNLGIHRWQIWSLGDERSVQDLVAPGGPRCLVVDLGSLGTWGEQAIAAESVLAALWRRRGEREPVLIVIDEAHNVCPREPADEVTALATEQAARIAAEGRKFGLYLLVSTQRPLRMHELVVSQCDNVVLMRMNAAADLAYIADVLSFAPKPLLERSTGFHQGASRSSRARSPRTPCSSGSAPRRGGRLGRARHLGRAGPDPWGVTLTRLAARRSLGVRPGLATG